MRSSPFHTMVFQLPVLNLCVFRPSSIIYYLRWRPLCSAREVVFSLSAFVSQLIDPTIMKILDISSPILPPPPPIPSPLSSHLCPCHLASSSHPTLSILLFTLLPSPLPPILYHGRGNSHPTLLSHVTPRQNITINHTTRGSGPIKGYRLALATDRGPRDRARPSACPPGRPQLPRRPFNLRNCRQTGLDFH